MSFLMDLLLLLSFLLSVLDVSWLFYILLLLLYFVGAWRTLYPLCCVLCIIVYILNNSYLNYMCLFHQIGKYDHNLRSVVDSVVFVSVVVLLFLLVFIYLFYLLFYRAGFFIRHHVLNCILPGFITTSTYEVVVAVFVFDYHELWFGMLVVL